jgi:hypothetical protein
LAANYAHFFPASSFPSPDSTLNEAKAINFLFNQSSLAVEALIDNTRGENVFGHLMSLTGFTDDLLLHHDSR